MEILYERKNTETIQRLHGDVLYQIKVKRDCFIKEYIAEWKTYCNLIQNVTIQGSNNQSKLHQDVIHEVVTLKKHAKDIPQEQFQWFAKYIFEFS